MSKPLSADETIRLAEQVCKVFEAFDEDGNGKISASELEDVLCQLDASKWNSETCERLLHELDRNVDGSVDFTEFVNYVCDDRKPKTLKTLLTSDVVIELRSGELARKRDAEKAKEMQKAKEWEMAMDKELTEEEKEKERHELLKWASALCSISQVQVDLKNKLEEIAHLEKKMCNWCAVGTCGRPTSAVVGQYTKTLVAVVEQRGKFFEMEKSQQQQAKLWPRNGEQQVPKLLPRRHLLGKVSIEKWIEFEQAVLTFLLLWPIGGRYHMRCEYEGSQWYWISEEEAVKEGRCSEFWQLSFHAFPAFDGFEADGADGPDYRGAEWQAGWRTLLDSWEIVKTEMPNL